jgi:hypothetical protein
MLLRMSQCKSHKNLKSTADVGPETVKSQERRIHSAFVRMGNSARMLVGLIYVSTRRGEGGLFEHLELQKQAA